MIKKYIRLIMIMFIIFLYRNWIFSFDLITHGDRWYISSLLNWHYDPYIRRSVFTKGSILLDISQFSRFFYWFLWKLWLDYSLAERVIFLWPCIILSVAWFYKLGKYIFKSDIAWFFASIVFCFNTYILTLQTWHITLMTAFSVFPWIFLAYDQFLLKRNLKNMLYSILLFLVSFWYEPRSAYIIAIILVFYTIYTLLKGSKINVWIWVVGIVIMILCNIWRYLPLSHSLWDISNNEIFNRWLFGSSFFNLLYSFTLHHPFWSWWQMMIFKNQAIPLYFWLIPVFAFWWFITNRKNPYMYFFTLISLLGIFLSKQEAQPFMGVYQWLYIHFPWFNAFREASKFYFLIAIWYSVMIWWFVDWIWKSSKIAKYIKYVCIGSIALIFLWNTKPLITGEIWSLFVWRHMPQDYSVLNKFLETSSLYGRTMSMPRDSRWISYSNDLPKLSLIDELLGTYKDSWYTWKNTIDQIESFMKMTWADYLLDTSSIRYVILPMVDFENDDDFFADYGDPYDDPRNSSKLLLDQVKKESKVRSLKLYTKYYSILKNTSYLREIDIWTKEVKIFENIWYMPLISTTSQTTYNFINPTKYNIVINIPRSSTGQELRFLQTMHPERKLYPWVSIDNCTQTLTTSGWMEYDDVMQPMIYMTRAWDTINSIQQTHQLTWSQLVDYNTGVSWLRYKPYNTILKSWMILIVGYSDEANSTWSTTECIWSWATFFQWNELHYITEQPLRENTHHKIYNYANARTIDLSQKFINSKDWSTWTYLQKWLKEWRITTNPDWSYNVALTLYFRPQSRFYLWLMISWATLVVILCLLWWYSIRKLKQPLTLD